jgi:hypothetical protein
LHTGSIQAGSKAGASSIEYSGTWSAIDRSATFPMSRTTIPDAAAMSATGCVANNCPGDANAAMRAAMLTVEPKRSVALRSSSQWYPWLGSASWKQTSEHLKGGCRVRKPKHRFVANPLDRRPEPSEGLAHQLLEAPKHRYCRRIAIDICYRAEARQIDKRDGRDPGLEAVDSTDVHTHSRLWWAR